MRCCCVTIAMFLILVGSVSADDRWTTVLEGKYIFDIVHTDNGVTWLGGGTVYRYENGVFATCSKDFPDDGYGLGNCQAIVVHGDSVWIGGDGDLLMYDGETWSTMLYYNEHGYSIRYLAVSPSGDVWVGTVSGGLMKYDGETWSQYTFNDNPWYNQIASLAVGDDGIVWVGTYVDGLWSFDGETWTGYTTADGLADDTVTALVVDDNGIWCGTTEGLSYFSGTSWTTYTTTDGLAHNIVNSIAFGINGDLWVSTGIYSGSHDKTPCEYTTTGGLSHFDDGVWTSYTMDDGLVRNFIYDIAVTPEGIVWCGTLCGTSIFTPDQTTVADTSPEPLPLLTINGNYPNPANPATTLDFTVSGETLLTLTIRNMLGQHVRTLSSGRYHPGRYNVLWDGTDSFGNRVSSGLYFGVYDTGSFLEALTITVVR